MDDYQCFAFFCEDARSEEGGKTSYMGVVGPKIILGDMPIEAPTDAVPVLAKLVIVAMIRTSLPGPIPLKLEVIIKDGPDHKERRFRTEQQLPIATSDSVNLAQFHAQMPNVPAHPGMIIEAKFDVAGQAFSTSLIIQGPESKKRKSKKRKD